MAKLANKESPSKHPTSLCHLWGWKDRSRSWDGSSREEPRWQGIEGLLAIIQCLNPTKLFIYLSLIQRNPGNTGNLKLWPRIQHIDLQPLSSGSANIIVCLMLDVAHVRFWTWIIMQCFHFLSLDSSHLHPQDPPQLPNTKPALKSKEKLNHPIKSNMTERNQWKHSSPINDPNKLNKTQLGHHLPCYGSSLKHC